MWVIKRIRIKNFRSIVEGEFSPGKVSIIVGENDAGKSNYLRALNLFFNNETDVGRQFSFASDFSLNATVGKGKARQIEIALYIEPPATFSDRDMILWKRYWRDDSMTYVGESFHRLPGNREIQLKSKAIQWLRRFRYRYVPAIKGGDYFASLMRDLHDSLAETVDGELRSAASDFIGVVRNHTAGISERLKYSISLESKLQLPPNLRALFEVLDFSTSRGEAELSLQLRGDGIKVRHIPAVLSFLADQERRLAPAGKPRPTAIWGYEEPENNLEMKRAFEHANELYVAREFAQILITTHSPAFYGLATSKRDDVWAFGASVEPARGTQLRRVSQNASQEFDVSLGLMPLVAPYVEEKARELAEVQKEIQALNERVQEAKRLMVLVAGETDVDYLRAAMDVHCPGNHSHFDVLCIGKKGVGGSIGAGDPRLISIIEQWNTRPELLSRRVIVIFDSDVKKLPNNFHSMVELVQLPKNSNNAIAACGIENLLPESVFLQKFYRVKTEKLAYGGVKETRTLDKVMLCNAVCSPRGELYESRSVLLEGFKVVCGTINSRINCLTA
ncbi:MAG TPA: AAA family ATPase [Vicinamibacterales bacterium]|nr:AAA family ATPase [Vicinamibacterales bacterium]